MRFGPARDYEDVQINLTPLIDVVFLLLIFFMVTTTFSKESQLRIQLPAASEPYQNQEQPNIVRIDISAQGMFAIKRANESVAKTLINRAAETLLKEINSATQDLSDPIVVIRADKRVAHETVIKAMDVVRRAGINKLTFATESQSDHK